MKQKIFCQNCKHKIRKHGISWFKGKFLCPRCKARASILMPFVKDPISLGEALARTYKIRNYKNKKGYIQAWRTFPSILAGKKVRLILVK